MIPFKVILKHQSSKPSSIKIPRIREQKNVVYSTPGVEYDSLLLGDDDVKEITDESCGEIQLKNITLITIRGYVCEQEIVDVFGDKSSMVLESIKNSHIPGDSYHPRYGWPVVQVVRTINKYPEIFGV